MFDNTEKEIIELLSEILELGNININRHDSFESLGLDSIKFMNLLIGLEDIIGKDLEDVVDNVDFSEIVVVDHLFQFVKKSM